MAVKTLFLVSSILAASTLSAAAVELLNPHDVLNKTRRDMNAFDQRMKGYKAEQQKKEKEAEAKRKNKEAERQKRENAEKALQEAHTQWTRRRKVQRGAGSAPSRGGVAAVRWAAQTTSPSSASRRGQKRDGERRCGGT